MAHKVLPKDMHELVAAMKLAQQYCDTTLDVEYKKYEFFPLKKIKLKISQTITGVCFRLHMFSLWTQKTCWMLWMLFDRDMALFLVNVLNRL